MPPYTLLWSIQSLAKAQGYICSARAFKSSFLALPLIVYSKRLIFHWKLSCTIAALSLTHHLVCNAQRALPLKYTIPFRMSCQDKNEELVAHLCPMVIWGAWDYRATPSVSEALWMLSQVVWRILQHSYLYLCTLGCFRKTLFQENWKYNPPRISLGVSLKGSKRIFNFDKV